ncbi:MAG: bifunctional aldolase/short-chain dehydrogenase [Planctomycetes bacterium]|nr:bifunctional aldolase/short-chain dehydrogenase [Planctomycetota bacterium]
MQTRWTEAGAQQALDRWAPAFGELLALRLYTARLLGEDAALVLHGGGNISLKGRARTLLDEVDVLFIKGSGVDLAVVEPADLPAVQIEPLRRLRSLTHLSDDDMVREVRRHLLDPAAPTPSIETLLHAFLPQRYVDHSHADAVLALTNQPNGADLIREALGDRALIVPYVRPGFELARAVAEAFEVHLSAPSEASGGSSAASRGALRPSSSPAVEGVVLLHHGLITFGDDARTSYERHLAIVDACERFLECRGTARPCAVAARDAAEPAAIVARMAPVLRGLLAHATGDEDRPFRRRVMEWRALPALGGLAGSADLRRLCDTGPVTCDHLIRTRPWPLLVDPPAGDEAAWSDLLRREVQAYRQRYAAYVSQNGGRTEGLDTAPRVVLVPGAGALCWGETKRDALIAADITEHTLAVQLAADSLGRYVALAERELYEMEFRDLQRRKLGVARDRPLDGQVVAVSGGAGAIGAAIAEVCAEAGAHVALADVDEARLQRVVAELEARFGRGTAFGVRMNVTEEADVARGFERMVLAFGGVDVVVPNAGIAQVGAVDQLTLADFRRVMEVNAVGYFLFMQAGIRLLKQQGLGGHIIVNASKNVFAPGRDFGAYSASKAAGHQLAKVAAIELAPFGIRVNMINADAVFGDAAHPSGLWQQVGPARAQSRNLDPQALPEYYRQRNLLKTVVHGRHVGNAVVFFASNATPTVGATLPVDGGVMEAFPR